MLFNGWMGFIVSLVMNEPHYLNYNAEHISNPPENKLTFKSAAY